MAGDNNAYLEIWEPQGARLVELTGEQMALGKSTGNDVVIAGDPMVSRLHAVLERIGAGWCVTDLGSANGTHVNGAAVIGRRSLQPGDEITVGRTRIVFRHPDHADTTATMRAEAPPALTKRERDVLVALCRPMLDGKLFTQPASIKQMASELFVSEAAVKSHLVNLYDKFGVHERGESRRGRLADDAIRRGAVTVADLRDR